MPPLAAEKKNCTYEDLLNMPEAAGYELMEGELLMTPSPVVRHQRISREIEFMLKKFVAEKDLGEMLHAPCDVFFDKENVVQPDILFISKERLNIIGEKNIEGAPDIVIEIVSESTAYRDMVQKKKLYAFFGVPEYWIVIPESESIEVLVLKDKNYSLLRSYEKNSSLESPRLKGFKMELKRIFWPTAGTSVPGPDPLPAPRA